ncbi:40s ribosomal protein s5-1 [Hordeum vulgare]|nr:40s ribosomal protein s5-1 [Hordeum vulgare]
MWEGMLHIRDVEGPKKTGSMETRLEAMEQQVFKCQGMVERGLNANHMMIIEFTNKHRIDANDIGKHLSRLYDRVDQLQGQIYDLQNQNCEYEYRFKSIRSRSGHRARRVCLPSGARRISALHDDVALQLAAMRGGALSDGGGDMTGDEICQSDEGRLGGFHDDEEWPGKMDWSRRMRGNGGKGGEKREGPRENFLGAKSRYG